MTPGDQIQVETHCRVSSNETGAPYLEARVSCRNVLYFQSSVLRLTYETRGAIREILVNAARDAIDEELGRLLESE